jgi:hypothetical protein
MCKAPTTSWRVKLNLAFKDQGPEEKCKEIPGFGIDVENNDSDLAKKKARKWLQDKGEKVRSVSISAKFDNTVVVVIVRDRPKK